MKIDDWNDWYIEKWKFPCENKEQLNKREEGEMIREIGTVNKQIAGRTYKENLVRYSQSSLL